MITSGSPKDTLASYYEKIFDKYADSTEGATEWLAKEKKRLSTMASKKGSLAGKQLKEIQQKKNVSSEVLAGRLLRAVNDKLTSVCVFAIA